MNLCNNSDQTWFCHSLTFARSLGRRWKTPASPSVFNTSLGTLWMLMNGKSCLIPISCVTLYVLNHLKFITSSRCDSKNVALQIKPLCVKQILEWISYTRGPWATTLTWMYSYEGYIQPKYCKCCMQEKWTFRLPWQQIKFSSLDLIHMVVRGLLKEHYCKAFVKIPKVR